MAINPYRYGFKEEWLNLPKVIFELMILKIDAKARPTARKLWQDFQSRAKGKVSTEESVDSTNIYEEGGYYKYDNTFEDSKEDNFRTGICFGFESNVLQEETKENYLNQFDNDFEKGICEPYYDKEQQKGRYLKNSIIEFVSVKNILVINIAAEFGAGTYLYKSRISYSLNVIEYENAYRFVSTEILAELTRMDTGIVPSTLEVAYDSATFDGKLLYYQESNKEFLRTLEGKTSVYYQPAYSRIEELRIFPFKSILDGQIVYENKLGDGNASRVFHDYKFIVEKF